MVARLAPGVSLAAANDDMDRVAKELERQFPNSNTNVGAVVVPVKKMRSAIRVSSCSC